jgi:hypothetical protein
MRDVANLAVRPDGKSALSSLTQTQWRLPLILNGSAPDTLLDTYSVERRSPCKFLIDLAVKLGPSSSAPDLMLL